MNPYLQGNFAPVDQELTAFDLPVRGTIPEGLDGRYLRNGPNPAQAPDQDRYHWFTGHGMVHGIELRDGQAQWYRNRWVRSPEVATILGEPSPANPFTDDRMIFAANTNVVSVGGRTFAVVEAGSPPIELDDELATIAVSDFDGTLPYGYTAHPKRDPETGDLHAAAYWWGWDQKIQYLVIGPDAHVKSVADIAVTGQPMVHDLAITKRWAVLFDLPVTFNMEAAMDGWPLPYRWDPSYPARVGLLPLGATTDETIWFDVEPCYVYHPMNAFDAEDGRVVVDVVRHPKMFDTDVRGPNEGPPTLDRWTLDPSGGPVKEERLSDRPQELPRVDERLVGRPHRYGYGVSFWEDDGVRFGPVVRTDLTTGAEEVHDFGPGCGAMEPVFVPREEGAAEDDGWVLTVVYDAARDTSDLVVLAAQDFTGDPVASIELPQRVPFGFHGNWVPA
jgi:carotenoid cleavage dioxygenase